MKDSFETTLADFHGFDPQRLYAGEMIDDWPEDVVFYPEDNETWSRLDDVLMNSYMDTEHFRAYIFPIYSKRLREAIEDGGITDFQFLECRVRDAKGLEFPGYAMANVLTFRDALDTTRSKVYYHDSTLPKVNVAENISAIVTPALLKSQLNSCHAFRLREDARNLFVSEHFRKIYRTIKATGISFEEALLVK